MHVGDLPLRRDVSHDNGNQPEDLEFGSTSEMSPEYVIIIQIGVSASSLA